MENIKTKKRKSQQTIRPFKKNIPQISFYKISLKVWLYYDPLRPFTGYLLDTLFQKWKSCSKKWKSCSFMFPFPFLSTIYSTILYFSVNYY